MYQKIFQILLGLFLVIFSFALIVFLFAGLESVIPALFGPGGSVFMFTGTEILRILRIAEFGVALLVVVPYLIWRRRKLHR